MPMIKVKFLGENYEISTAITEYLHYDELLTPMRKKVLDMLSYNISKDSKKLEYGGEIAGHIHNNVISYKNVMEECVSFLVNTLLELGIYDVTANDLLENTTSEADINNLERNTFAKLLEEGQRFVDMKNAGIERAYNYAASNITGSGTCVFSSSISTLMIHSAIERGILLSQAKKADKEYQEAVRIISQKTVNALDRMYSEVMIKEYYPSIMNIMLDFDSKIMSAFLTALVNHNKFDFASIEKYNMKKAEEMLKNIHQVSDKIEFLKQTFLTCPFCAELYEKAFELELLDTETFETAIYFGCGETVVEKMRIYIKSNLEKTEKLYPLITMLATYNKSNEIEIWREVYCDNLTKLNETYNSFNASISDKKKLDNFIKTNLKNTTAEIVKLKKDDIIDNIQKIMKSTISENQYNKLVELEIISPENIRISTSNATTIIDINAEIIDSLTYCIMEYIAEATKRLENYNIAMSSFEKELKLKKDELSNLKESKNSLGLFAFSKKKDLTASIIEKEKEISTFCKENEPIALKRAFENMYA